MSFKKILAVLYAIPLVLLATTAGFAQVDQGKISGTVTDEAKKAIAGATVAVRNAATGEERTVTTNDQGGFTVTGLKAAAYLLTVNATNFSPLKTTSVEVLAGQTVTLDFTLKPGEVAETVDVTATADNTGLETGSATVGANVTKREVASLPLNGRQLSQLYLQAPGAVNTGNGSFGDIRFSGRSNEQNAIRYDGVEGSAIIDGNPGNLNGEIASPFRLQSSLENVQEFRVDSTSYPAEFGTGTGGQITVVTKSGSNQFHGGLFEFLRNDALDARNQFDRRKSPLRLNQFGGSVGGPIIKDKAFFFFSYEGYRFRTGVNAIEAVPSAAAAARAVPSIQPLLAAFRGPGAVVLQGASQNPDFDILQLNSNVKVDENAVGLRLDYHFNANHSVYARYFRDQGLSEQPEGVTGRRVVYRAVPQNGVFAYQAVITPNVVNEFKFGYNGALTRVGSSVPTIPGVDLSNITINLTGSIANNGIPGQGATSGIAVPGGLIRGNSAFNGRGFPYTPYTYSFLDTVSWVRGSHTFKFGGEERFIRIYTDRLGGTTYSFSNLNAFLANQPSAIQFSDDLSNLSPFTGKSGQRFAKQNYTILYAQDEWKLLPNLTLNLGLRYEYYSPLREDQDRVVNFDINQGIILPPNRSPYISLKTNFQPRIAVAWSPFPNSHGFFGGGKTVIRAGFGIYTGPGQTEDQIQPIESDRIATTLNGVAAGGSGLYPVDPAVLRANFLNDPLNRRFQPRAYAPEYKIPERTYNYSVSVQQELPYKMVLTAAYIGTQGRNLFLRSFTNRILPGNATVAVGSALPAGTGVVNLTDSGTGRIVGVRVIREFDLINQTGPGSLQTPYAEIDFKTSGGSDRYDALNLALARRFNSGLTLNAQYTLSRSFGNTSGSNDALTAGNPFDYNYDRGYNAFDVRNSFNLSAIYDLPIGRGKTFLKDAGRVTNLLVGGWEVGTIVNARSGLPIDVRLVRPDVVIRNPTTGEVRQLPGTINAANPLPDGFVAVVNTPGGGSSRNVRRPDLVPGVNPFVSSGGYLFLNPAAFAVPAPGQFGNLERGKLHGPNFRQVDFIAVKKFIISERTNLEFRAEFYNIFNLTNFANPVATLSPILGTGLSGSVPQVQPGTPLSGVTVNNPSFGRFTSTVERAVGLGANRQIQFALRFNF
jgi:hypothetical protein